MCEKERSQLLERMDEDPRARRAFRRLIWRRREHMPRTVLLGTPVDGRFPRNVVHNQKYSILTFLPLVLFEQFKFFLNLFFLLIALSQFVQPLRIGDPITYWLPLGFVLSVTLIREAYEDFCRFLRDRKINRQQYCLLSVTGCHRVMSQDINVGDVIVLHKNERIPADVILLRTSERSGACFIRTDQLDGETDWKLRLAVPFLQQLKCSEELFETESEFFAESPNEHLHTFVGTCRMRHHGKSVEYPLSIENVLWASTTLTAGSAVGVVVYTGRETRSRFKSSSPHCKVGLLDNEINQLTKYLFVLLAGLTAAAIAIRGFEAEWPRETMRFALLFSYIVPISLRVNLEMAKLYNAYAISHDKMIPGTQVRNSSIPEELGRIFYLLTDKTGTLTKNEMKFRKLHIGSLSLNNDSFDYIADTIDKFNPTAGGKLHQSQLQTRIYSAVEAIALCHNVTPVMENGQRGYQAASPDEIALVEWAERVGVQLEARTLDKVVLAVGRSRRLETFFILHTFPFTAERKRMGIIVKHATNDEILFICKGADSVMEKMVGANDWLEEECANMAREGLRTLVVAKRTLPEEEYELFSQQYHEASMQTVNRTQLANAVIDTLEKDMQLLAATGVEDQLQDDVRASVESLMQAGVKICMLTGDKLETAVCIAKSCGLVKKTSAVFVMSQQLQTEEQAVAEVARLQEKILPNSVLVAMGNSLEKCLHANEKEMAQLFSLYATVVFCRCSPEQKAKIVTMLKNHMTPYRVAAVGDGGNDVAMIQAAHVGIGIESKEGKQASLAADFAIGEFSALCPLFLVHGRHSYKQTCILAQFVMYRGVILTVLQALFIHMIGFVTMPVFDNFLMATFTAIYTPLAVFSIVVDRDTSVNAAMTYGELYKGMRKGRSLSLKTFLIWVLVGVYQGGSLFYGFYLLGDENSFHFQTAVFSGLVLTQLLMVFAVFRRLHWAMVASEVQCLGALIGSWFVLTPFFDRTYILSWHFYVVTACITLAAVLPLFALRYLKYKFAAPSATKVK